MIGALTDPIERIGLFRIRCRALTRRAACRARLGHGGSRISPPGCCYSASLPKRLESERIVSLKPSEASSLHGYDLTLDGMMPRPGPNYRETDRALHRARTGGVSM